VGFAAPWRLSLHSRHLKEARHGSGGMHAAGGLLRVPPPQLCRSRPVPSHPRCLSHAFPCSPGRQS
jgi:hypothetical protein